MDLENEVPLVAHVVFAVAWPACQRDENTTSTAMQAIGTHVYSI